MKNSVLIGILLVTAACASKGQKSEVTTKSDATSKEAIVERYLKKGAWNYRYFAPEWQLYIDSAIAVNPTIAYLYQQKAMPYFKQGKYEAGMAALDKAVELEPLEYLDYRAFIKCVFAKTYREAIRDFLKSKELMGNEGFVMDHSYDFYIGLCYLQLNEFEKALTFMEKSISISQKSLGERWIHHLDLFYAGIACHELQRHQEAIAFFDRALTHYSNFSDAEYYKAISLHRTGQQEKAVELLTKCETDFKAGYTINEDNAIYETYPYQIKQWHIEMVRRR